MGYAHYVLPNGREAGYAVEAACDEPGCEAEIDRGLAYLCGVEPGGSEDSCGDYFCEDHLFFLVGGPAGGRRCNRCLGYVDGMRDAAAFVKGDDRG